MNTHSSSIREDKVAKKLRKQYQANPVSLLVPNQDDSIPKKLNNTPLGIMIGGTGVGKTTLLNMLSGTSHNTRSGVRSVTQSLSSQEVTCGGDAFRLIDTPWVDSTVKAYMHAFLLKEGLQRLHYNTIFVVMRYHPGPDQIPEIFKKLAKPVGAYKKMWYS